MRWTVGTLLALFALWAFFIVSPFVALYRFAQAIEARDAAAIEERVDLRAVRLSLAKQIAQAYLAANGKTADAGSMGTQLAIGAGATVADPVIARFVSVEALLRFLDESRVPAGAGTGAMAPALAGLNFGSVLDAWRVFIGSESRGFRTVLVPVPNAGDPEERVRLQMRLAGPSSGFLWRLVGVELPASLRDRLVREIPRENA